jgi:ankyrin repeat protein
LKALLDAGASTKLTDRSGATPRQLAAQRGYGEMLRLLDAAGAR